MKELKRHAPFWILIYIVWTYIKSNSGEHLETFLIINLFNVAVYMTAYYSLMYVYIPFYFRTEKYVFFTISLILTSILLYLFMQVNDIIWFHKLGEWEVEAISLNQYLRRVIQYYSPAMILLAWESHMNSINEQKRIQELENEQLTTELKFLKAQLNPHFLFNTLNNLYAQVITESGKAPGMILQLSGIFDYVLYKSQKKTVPLTEEIDIIEHFLALEKIRYGDRLEVKLDAAGDLSVPISPLLFLSLVENAFKHGVRKDIEKAIVKIEINEKNDEVLCRVWNTKSNSHKAKREGHRDGLGLSNIRRQLAITYPNTHSIQIEETEKSYCVEVSIKIEL